MALVPPPSRLEVLLVVLMHFLTLLGFGPGVNASDATEYTKFHRLAWDRKIQAARLEST